MSRLSILGSVVSDDVRRSPFAHVIRRSVLPDDLYAELATSFPGEAAIVGPRRIKQNFSARLPAFKVAQDGKIPQLWRDFFSFHTSADFWSEIVRVFGTALRETYPDIEAHAGRPLSEWRAGPRVIRAAKEDLEVKLDCQFVINTPATQTSSVRTQHVDKATTLFSMLYYFRLPDDASTGGDLQLYRWKGSPRLFKHNLVLPSDVDGIEVVRYSANTLVAFINSPQAVHGVSPRSPSVLPRRYVNFIAEIPFKAFDLRRVGVAQRLLHWREVRKFSFRNVGRDRY